MQAGATALLLHALLLYNLPLTLILRTWLAQHVSESLSPQHKGVAVQIKLS